MDQPSSCFAQDYTYLDGSNPSAMPNNYYTVILSNGVSLGIYPAQPNIAGYFIVDINGLKKPNIQGRDLFGMSFYYDGSLDSVTPECRHGGSCGSFADARENRETRFNDTMPIPGYGQCFGKIINDDWKMDY